MEKAKRAIFFFLYPPVKDESLFFIVGFTPVFFIFIFFSLRKAKPFDFDRDKTTAIYKNRRRKKREQKAWIRKSSFIDSGRGNIKVVKVLQYQAAARKQ